MHTPPDRLTEIATGVFAATGPADFPVTRRLETAERERWSIRLWDRDTSLFTDDPAMQDKIANRLGWLGAPESVRDQLGAWPNNANQIAAWWIMQKRLMGRWLRDDLQELGAL